MDTKEKFRKVLEEYKKTLNKYEEVISEYEKDDNVLENEYLKKELEKYKEQLNAMKADYENVKKNNSELKIMLHEQMVNEKIDILNASREKMRIYFKNNSDKAQDRLTQLENSVKAKYSEVNEFLQSAEREIGDSFKQKVDLVYDQAKEKIKNLREKTKEELGVPKDLYIETSEKMRDEEIDEEAMKKKIQNNNIEMKIGLDFVNKVGIILILLSVASGFAYVHENWLDNYGKGIVAFLIGITFIGIGEFFYRKNKQVFATGLLGGGVAILYYSIYYSYFGLHIIDINMALVLSVLITTLTILLSLRYNSKVICGMALIGGYFPFVSYVSQFGINEQGAYISMCYLLILNTTLIVISIYKRWTSIKYISFLLNIPSMLYLMSIVGNLHVNIIYAVATFGMYTFITLSYGIKNGVQFEEKDILLLALNTIISSIAIYQLFEKAKITEFRGILAILFCLIYIYLAKLVKDRVKADTYVRGLFYITALTFAILIIPFQFGLTWVTLGWTIQGVIVTIYGLKRGLPSVEKAGWIILGICSANFLVLEALTHLGTQSIHMFELKYTAYMLSLAVILIVYHQNGEFVDKFSERGKSLYTFKCFTVINTWIYAIYISTRLYSLYMENMINDTLSYGYNALLKTLIIILITIFVCKCFELIDKEKQDKFILGFNSTMYVLSALMLMLVISSKSALTQPVYQTNNVIEYFGLILILLTSTITFWMLKDLIKSIIVQNNFNFELYPLIINIYFLYLLLTFITYQLGLGDISFMVSLIFLVAAFAYIVAGFKKNYIYLRRFGLGLSLFAVAKLAFYDLAFLDVGLKIIAYFIFGVITLLISLFYQNLKNNMEDKF